MFKQALEIEVYFKLILKESHILLSPQEPLSILISEAVTQEGAPAPGPRGVGVA